MFLLWAVFTLRKVLISSVSSPPRQAPTALLFFFCVWFSSIFFVLNVLKKWQILHVVATFWPLQEFPKCLQPRIFFFAFILRCFYYIVFDFVFFGAVKRGVPRIKNRSNSRQDGWQLLGKELWYRYTSPMGSVQRTNPGSDSLTTAGFYPILSGQFELLAPNLDPNPSPIRFVPYTPGTIVTSSFPPIYYIYVYILI